MAALHESEGVLVPVMGFATRGADGLSFPYRLIWDLPGRACHLAALPSLGLKASCHRRAIRGKQFPALGRAP